VGELVGVDSAGSSGVVPVEGTNGGVDGDALPDQGRSGIVSDIGVPCGLGLDHDVLSTVRICRLTRSVHDVSSRCAHSLMKFTLLW